jgi:glutathione peroxidase
MTRLSDFRADRLEGGEEPLSDYDGKVVLVVNTASKCGFTPQLTGLEELYRTYQDRGLVVLGFPCNQFGNQEPGDADEIAGVCQRNYGVSFPMFAKIDVNGEDAHPLYRWLRSEARGVLGTKVRWNFTKFLLAPDGSVVRRFGSATKPEKIAPAIEALLPGR